MMLFLEGFGSACGLWIGLSVWAYRVHGAIVQAALNMPAASSHEQLQRAVKHEQRLRKRARG